MGPRKARSETPRPKPARGPGQTPAAATPGPAGGTPPGPPAAGPPDAGAVGGDLRRLRGLLDSMAPGHDPMRCTVLFVGPVMPILDRAIAYLEAQTAPAR